MIFKLLAAISGLGLICLLFKPILFAQFYLFSRTILQNFSLEQNYVGGIFPLTAIPAFIMMAYSLAAISLNRNFTFKRSIFLPLGIFIFYSILTIVQSINYTASVTSVFKIACCFSFFMLVHNIIQTNDDAIRILKGIFLSSIIPMCVGYYQFFLGEGGKGIEGVTNRMKGTLGFANAYGIFLALIFSACLMIILNKDWKYKRWIMVPVLSSVLVSTVLSLNRGTWIALGISIATASLLYFRNINKKWFIITAIILILGFSSIVAKRFSQLSNDRAYMPGNTLQQRVDYWKVIYPLVLKKPVLGWGIGTSTYVTKKMYKIDSVAHNDYLRIAMETGFFGLFLYLGFIFRELIRYLGYVRDRTNWYINYPMLIGIIYFLIISFAQNIYDHIINFSLFLSLLAVADRWNALSVKKKLFK